MSDHIVIATAERLWELFDKHPGAWECMAAAMRWSMPFVSRWQRLPIVRHWLYLQHTFRMGWRSAKWGAAMPPGIDYDIWVAWGLLRGKWHKWPGSAAEINTTKS